MRSNHLNSRHLYSDTLHLMLQEEEKKNKIETDGNRVLLTYLYMFMPTQTLYNTSCTSNSHEGKH